MCVLAFLTISVSLMLAHYLSERHLYPKLGSLLVLFNFRVPFLVGHNAFLTSIVPLMLAHYLSERPEWWSPPLCFAIFERALPILKPMQLGTYDIMYSIYEMCNCRVPEVLPIDLEKNRTLQKNIPPICHSPMKISILKGWSGGQRYYTKTALMSQFILKFFQDFL